MTWSMLSPQWEYSKGSASSLTHAETVPRLPVAIAFDASLPSQGNTHHPSHGSTTSPARAASLFVLPGPTRLPLLSHIATSGGQGLPGIDHYNDVSVTLPSQTWQKGRCQQQWLCREWWLGDLWPSQCLGGVQYLFAKWWALQCDTAKVSLPDRYTIVCLCMSSYHVVGLSW